MGWSKVRIATRRIATILSEIPCSLRLVERPEYTTFMRFLTALYPSIAARVAPPVCIPMGAPKSVAFLVQAMNLPGTTCFQMDLFPGARLREDLQELGAAAEVVTAADLWDLPQRFNTVLLPAGSHTDRELKLDLIEQGYHILKPGGVFITLSEYEKDTEFAKLHKKMFGKCGETPSSKDGMAFFSTKTEESRERRRHETHFHARVSGGPSMDFLTRPGVFSYGRMDNGSRALLEVADVRDGDRLLDLGSGCGVVGCLASTKAKLSGVTFIDSHLRANAVCEINAKTNGIANYEIVCSETMSGLTENSFDVILANPPYYGDSMVARLFIEQSRKLLKPGGRFQIVTKMPTAVVPVIFEAFGGCDVVENRGYSIVVATVS